MNIPTGKILNPYHTQEFSYTELRTLLESIFSDVKVTGQKYVRYDAGKVNRFGKFIFWFFNIVGIRKLAPFAIKNRISLFFTRKPFYPVSDDFLLVTDERNILKCKTFFCICRK